MSTYKCTETTENPFKFTGQYFDVETGEYYLRNRQYEPPLMRFTTMDLVSGKYEEPITLHKYLYCRNEPINKMDPSGLWDPGYGMGDRGWHGHNDFGYHRDDFDYESLDDLGPTSPYFGPFGTKLHFLNLDQAQMFVYMALLSGEQSAFGNAGHMGQDYFSHYGKGYSTVGTFGHLPYAHDPDNPYVYDKEGKIIGTSSEYKEADKWTKQMEELWYLFDDPYKWIGASD
jgi:RHS repeat-associated protein